MDEGAITTIPRAQSIIIERPRLTKILDEAEARIILLCAPAGYGKTTLARQWTERRAGVVWYSGGPAMSDVAAFAAGLAAALAEPGAAEKAAARVERLASASRQPRALARAVASAATAPSLLVIDDYHHAVESAEVDELVTELLAQTSFRMLLTTRVRPRWVKPRMSVYGEALVIGMDELAFDEGEATTVLPNADSVLARARGWPAVIGLAAVRASTEGPTNPLNPSELYDFFAEDLFGRIGGTIQHGLFALALAGDADVPLGRSLLGDVYDEVVSEGIARGFIGRTPSSVLTIHPLLRAFLLAKLEEHSDGEVDELLGRVLAALTARRRWDASLSALERFPRVAPIIQVVEHALRDLLSAGRVATLNRWLTLARVVNASHPLLLLLEAEIASYEGDYDRARVLGERAGSVLLGDDAASAFVVAARAAHLQGDDVTARRCAERAEAAALSPQRQQAALWTAFTTATENDRELAARILERLRSLAGSTAADALRVLTAEATLCYELGDGERAISAADSALVLIANVDDAFARTSALQVSATIAVQVGRYADALERARKLIEEGRSSGLEFVLGHALLDEAMALIGTRRLLQADRALNEVARHRPPRDEHMLANCELQRARLAMVVGDLTRASALLTRSLAKSVAPGTRDEYIAYRGLIAAAQGERPPEEVEVIRNAEPGVRFGSAQVVADLALSIELLARRRPRATESAAEALRRAFARLQLDVVVSSCRVFPDLARVGAAEPDIREVLREALMTSRDFDIGRYAGLEMPRELRRNEPLSPREREVYEYLVNGRSNREIAKALFISESTTKVHVRHIFEKLGVHSRAEAARAEVDER